MVIETVFDKYVGLADILKSSAHKCGDYYYLPLYFKIDSDGRLIGYHINNIPDDLKEMIITERNPPK